MDTGEERKQELLCDFCLERTDFGYFRTEPFTLYGQVGFDEKWQVCPLCWAVIEKEQWGELSARAIAGCILKQQRIEDCKILRDGTEHWYRTIPQLVAKFREFKVGGFTRMEGLEKRRDAEEAPRPTNQPRKQ